MKNGIRTLLQSPPSIATNGNARKYTPRFKVWVLCLATLLAAPYSYHQCQLIEAFAHKRDVQNGIETLILDDKINHWEKIAKLKRILDTL